MVPEMNSQLRACPLRPNHEAVIDRAPHRVVSQLEIAVANLTLGAVTRLGGHFGEPHRDQP